MLQALTKGQPIEIVRKIRDEIRALVTELAEKRKALKAYQDVLSLEPGTPAAIKARNDYLKYFDDLPRQQARYSSGRYERDRLQS